MGVSTSTFRPSRTSHAPSTTSATTNPTVPTAPVGPPPPRWWPAGRPIGGVHPVAAAGRRWLPTGVDGQAEEKDRVPAEGRDPHGRSVRLRIHDGDDAPLARRGLHLVDDGDELIDRNLVAEHGRKANRVVTLLIGCTVEEADVPVDLGLDLRCERSAGSSWWSSRPPWWTSCRRPMSWWQRANRRTRPRGPRTAHRRRSSPSANRVGQGACPIVHRSASPVSPCVPGRT